MIGCFLVRWAATDIQGTPKPGKIKPLQPSSIWIFIAVSIAILVFGLILLVLTPKAEKEEKFHMDTKYQLFLLLLPFLALCFAFAYLPLLGWRYAFFDYKSGETLTRDNFVGFKWFAYLFQNQATRQDLIRVLRNTLQ